MPLPFLLFQAVNDSRVSLQNIQLHSDWKGFLDSIKYTVYKNEVLNLRALSIFIKK